MVAVRKFSSALGLMAIVNETLQLGIKIWYRDTEHVTH
jgi:hypothetical protein